MNCVTLFCYWGGATCDGPDGVTYNKPPNKAIKAYPGMLFDDLVDRIYRATSIDKQKHHIKVICRYPSVGVGKTIKYVLLPIKDNDDVDIMFDVLTLHQEVSTLDLYLEVEDNAPIRHTEMASRNLESAVIKEETSNELLPSNTSNAVPPLNDQLKKKKKAPPSPLPVAEKSDFIGKSRNDVNMESDVTAPKVNPKSSLTDSDWTELLSAPSKTINGSNGGVPRDPGLLKDGKRQLRSGSNSFALKRKRSHAVVDSSARRSDAAFRDNGTGNVLDGNQVRDNSDSKHATVGVQVKNVQNRPSLSGVPITSSSKKSESLSANDGVASLDTDSDSTSDSESKREREERRNMREKLSLEKIIDERAKKASAGAMPLRHRQSSGPQPDPHGIPREVEPQPDPTQAPEDADLHPFLRFTRADDRTNRDYLLGKAARYGYVPLRFLAWESLATVALQGRAEAVCGPHWCRLFSISQPVAQELAIEFFSTFHLVTPLHDLAREDALTFRLAGTERRLSLRQFATHMGLYLPAELDTPAFTQAIIDWPEGISAVPFWSEIGIGQYTSPNIPKSMKLRDPLHRVLHRAIVHSLTTRGESTGAVTHRDLFYLYCMIHEGPCQLARCLAQFLFSIRTSRVTQGIYGGGYVTLLAKAMDLLPREVADGLTFSAPATPINMDVLKHMKVAGMRGRRLVLLDHLGRPWVPPRVPGEGDNAKGGDARGDGGGDVAAQGKGHVEEEVHNDVHRENLVQELERLSTLIYQRDFQGRISRLETVVSELRDSQREMLEVQREMLEVQRLEFAHAEAHRLYSARMLRRLVANTHMADLSTVEEPPALPQRLADFYTQAGPSHTSHQSPPP